MTRDEFYAVLARARKVVPVKPVDPFDILGNRHWDVHAKRHVDRIGNQVGELLDCEMDRLGEGKRYGHKLTLEYSCGTVVHIEVWANNDPSGRIIKEDGVIDGHVIDESNDGGVI